jgi:hypothetical protein
MSSFVRPINELADILKNDRANKDGLQFGQQNGKKKI